MLITTLADEKLCVFFIKAKMIWHFMWIVSIVDDSHGMSKIQMKFTKERPQSRSVAFPEIPKEEEIRHKQWQDTTAQLQPTHPVVSKKYEKYVKMLFANI